MAAPAAAARFTATEIGYDNALLSNFNLVALGAWTSNATALGPVIGVDGRVIAGSVATGYNAACYKSTGCVGDATVAVDSTRQLYGALTVFGNVTGTNGSGVVGSFGGTTSIGGSASGAIYQNNTGTLNIQGSSSGLTVYSPGTKIQTSQTSFNGSLANNATGVKPSTGVGASTVFPFSSTALTSEIKNLAAGIAALPGSPGVSAQALPAQVAGNGLFTANADWTSNGKTYGVVTTTMANLAGQSNFAGISNGSNAATLVIVTGDGANYTLPNLNSYADAGKVIFEFVDAKVLNFAGSWNGSILAPLATINTMGGTINGTVIVNSIVQSQSILSGNMFVGDLTGFVPEPASMTLFGLGAAAAAFVRRKRRGAAPSPVEG